MPVARRSEKPPDKADLHYRPSNSVAYKVERACRTSTTRNRGRNSEAMRLIDRLALASTASGLLGGGVALWLGLHHNSQGEFFIADTGRLDIRYCALVFAAWFAIAGVAALLAALAVRGIVRVFRRG
jgi:hypothetical protein